MTSWVEGKRSFFIGSQASLIPDDREVASSWASPHVIHNPAYKYVLGRFVEADRANNNKQLFSLKGLQIARPTITHAPMNMSHDTRRVVGAFVAAELIYPTGGVATAADGESGPLDGAGVCTNCQNAVDFDADSCPNCGSVPPQRTKVGSDTSIQPGYAKLTASVADVGLNPYIEALGVFWRHYYPEEFALVQAAHSEGRLYYSMECVPSQIQCTGKGGCGAQFEYAGLISDTYCSHLNESSSDKFLIDPHFTAGAILVPPVKPGWSRADVHSLVARHSEFAERIYDGIVAEFPHLNSSEWEATMAELLVLAHR